MTMIRRLLFNLLFLAACWLSSLSLTTAFHVGSYRLADHQGLSAINSSRKSTTSLYMLDRDKDASRSGTKRGRLDRLAELEQDRVETDKNAVGLAAGGFAFLILLGVVAAVTLLQGPI